MRIDSSRIRKVYLPATRTAVDVDPQWSPDGKQIVFVRHNATAKPAGAKAVFVIKAHGTARRRVTPYRIKAGDGPHWSPDGSQILFRSPEVCDSSPPTGGRPPPASAYACAGGRVGGQARHACCGRGATVLLGSRLASHFDARLSHKGVRKALEPNWWETYRDSSL
jgi:dipeptidyl aminopeptidase/acylaminoacyl peptidase